MPRHASPRRKVDHFCGWMNNAIGENNLRYFALPRVARRVGVVRRVAVLRIRGEISDEVSGGGIRGPGGAPTTLARDRALLFRFVMYHFSPIVARRVPRHSRPSCSAVPRYHADDRRGRDHERTFKIKDYQRSARRRRGRETRMNRASGEVTVNEMDDDDRHVGCAGGAKAEDAAGQVDVDDVSSRGRGSPASIHILASSRTPHRVSSSPPQGVSNQSLGGVLPPSRASRAADRQRLKRGGVDASKKSRSIR